jgi:hypothetical protein
LKSERARARALPEEDLQSEDQARVRGRENVESRVVPAITTPCDRGLFLSPKRKRKLNVNEVPPEVARIETAILDVLPHHFPELLNANDPFVMHLQRDLEAAILQAIPRELLSTRTANRHER